MLLVCFYSPAVPTVTMTADAVLSTNDYVHLALGSFYLSPSSKPSGYSWNVHGVINKWKRELSCPIHSKNIFTSAKAIFPDEISDALYWDSAPTSRQPWQWPILIKLYPSKLNKKKLEKHVWFQNVATIAQRLFRSDYYVTWRTSQFWKVGQRFGPNRRANFVFFTIPLPDNNALRDRCRI